MKKKPLLHISTIVSFVFLLFALTACSSEPGREWLNAPDWSRAIPVAESRIGDPVPIALDEAGNLYLFLVTAVDGTASPHLIALNRQAQVMWEETLPVALNRPDQPQILWDGASLRLFWLSNQQLFTAQIDTGGAIIQAPTPISGETTTDSYDVALDKNGRLHVWFSGPRREPGLYALPTGDLNGEPILIDEAGIRPSLWSDTSGALRALWTNYPVGYGDNRFNYATYPDGVARPGEETVVFTPSLSTTDILEGPWLALEDDLVYVIWTISVRTGLEAGKLVTEYFTFPPDQPSLVARTNTIFVPSVPELAYEPAADATFVAGQRVPIGSGQYPVTPKVRDVIFPDRSAPELPLALSIEVQHEFRKLRNQVGLVFMQEGMPADFQLLSFTVNPSTSPSLAVGAENYLYLTWLEREESASYLVYLATTAPDLADPLNRITTSDVSRVAGESLFGMLSGAVLSPILVMLWLVVPLLLLGVTSFLRPPERGNWTHIGTIVSLALGIGVFWAIKLLSVPGIRTYVPFSAWIPNIPTWLQAPLQIGVPILSTLIGIVTAWYFTYRRDSDSLLYFFLLYAAIDGVLTMAVYGFLLYNVI